MNALENNGGLYKHRGKINQTWEKQIVLVIEINCFALFSRFADNKSKNKKKQKITILKNINIKKGFFYDYSF